MFKKVLLGILCCAFVLAISANTITPLSSCDSPLVGDHSGAPGETDCSGCHSSPVNPDLPELHFEIGTNDSTYIPGNTYLVHLYIKKPGHNKFGFVCSALDTLNSSKGTFGLINTTTTRTYSMGGRNYISHTPCGADNVDSISWTFNWTAPTANNGKISIYMSLLVANHNHALTGDTTYTRIITLSPSSSSSINKAINGQTAKVYPTVFSSQINLEFNSEFDHTIKQLKLINIEGKLIKKMTTAESKTVFRIEEHVNTGLYFLKIDYPGHSEVYKVFRQ
jgi:hypothetical protein